MGPYLQLLSRHRYMAVAVALCAAIAAWGVATVWRAQSSLNSAAIAVRSAEELPFSFLPFQGNANSPFQVVSAPADFRAAAWFDGSLFVCGKSGLYRYSADGTLANSWLAGRDLPAAPLTAVAVRRGMGSPELWMATDGAGVVAFDGHLFRHLLPSEKAYRKITSLLPLSGGRMLLGTAERGLLITGTATLRQFHPLFAKLAITALGGNEDELWIGTRNAGAYRWNAGRSRQYLAELPDPQILSIAAAPGRAWLGTALGVSEIQGDHFARNLAPGSFAQALALDPADGRLAIGTLNEGAFEVPLSAARPRPRPAERQTSSSEDPIEGFLATGGGLTALTPRALSSVASQKTLLVTPGAQLADGHIAALLLDQSGRLWVGYFDRGLDLIGLRGGSARHWEDDHLFCVNRIRESATGAVAVATANGLALFDRSGRLDAT